MGKKVRVLVGCVIGGIKFNPDQVVDLPDALAKSHAAAGEVDTHKEAVAYCVNELKAEVIAYAAPQPEVVAQLESEIADLEKQLADAADDAKESIQTALDEKRAALDDL